MTTPQQAGDATVDHDLQRRVAQLSLEQKVRLLTGADFWALHPEPAVGLRRLVVSDGPAGVRGERWDEREPSANIPSPTALAATWDARRVERLGALLAGEARRKGVDVVLAPTVNLHRTPYGGRHFECFSEDPLLTGVVGGALVRGLQGAGVGATVKHFVANDSETQRMTVDARVDEHTLRELYLAPFEQILREARPWAVMAAYNGVNGATMTESPLLRDVLQREWGFDGVVMSDWFATRSNVPAARAGLDLAMPGPDSPWTGGELVTAVRDGHVPESMVDDKVQRLLRLAARVGALDGVVPAGPPARVWAPGEIAAELRATAAAGMVLLRNQGDLLPVARPSLRRVAVIGPNAAVARTLGGGSATVYPPYTVAPLDGLRAALGDGVEVVGCAGVSAHTRVPTADRALLRRPGSDEPGADVEFLDGAGAVLATEVRGGGAFVWMDTVAGDVPIDRVHTVRVRTDVVAGQAGRYEIGGSGLGPFTLSVDGTPIADAELTLPDTADPVVGVACPPQLTRTVDATAGQRLAVLLEHRVPPNDIGIAFQLNLRPPLPDDDSALAEAEDLARDADLAVVVVGTTEEVESEGFDRETLQLPGRQDELARRVAAANPRTVAVVNAGAPVLLPWDDAVAAVLVTWFPGQEGGNALADVLLGATEPGGRLPVSWPAAEQGLPSTAPVDGALAYTEGLRVGYRAASPAALAPDAVDAPAAVDAAAGRDPGEGTAVGPAVAPRYRYPFGHGLGYTSWSYEHLDVDAADDGYAVTVRVRNTGARPGREVVQVYATRADSAVERPARWLVGFAGAEAAPDTTAEVTVPVPLRALRHWDTTQGAWAVEPGAYTLEVGPAAGHVALMTSVEVPAT